jgi:hypothetical protein
MSRLVRANGAAPRSAGSGVRIFACPLAMRINQPVTQQSIDFPEFATLMSVTDASSYIAYANEPFRHQ